MTGWNRRRGTSGSGARVVIALVVLIAGAQRVLASADPPTQEVLVVLGAPGDDEYAAQFQGWAQRWRSAAETGGADCVVIGTDGDSSISDRERLQQEIAKRAAVSTEPLWIVLIGHGTYDGKTARFNLRGPDISSTELAEWLQPVTRPLAVINCTSSSGPFLPELSAPNRVIITATRSGHEYNFARLGDALSSAMTDPAADLDKDDQTSLLEAWLLATANVREFYSNESRLLTEHALLDDNGDRLGTPADWFQGVRAVKTAKAGAALDGSLAAGFVLVRSTAEAALSPAAREKRDQLEQRLRELRARKADLTEEEYLQRLEGILLELAAVYEQSAPQP